VASPIAAFKQRRRKDILLPLSQLTVTIQVVDCMAFLGAGELPIPSVETGEPNGSTTHATTEAIALNLRYADRAIAMGVVDPPFSDRLDDRERDDVVYVGDLPFRDRLMLGQAILEWSGLHTEVAEATQAFRTDPERQTGDGVGGAVPQTPA
jgi:hypothetical protein